MAFDRRAAVEAAGGQCARDREKVDLGGRSDEGVWDCVWMARAPCRTGSCVAALRRCWWRCWRSGGVVVSGERDEKHARCSVLGARCYIGKVSQYYSYGADLRQVEVEDRAGW